MDCKLAYQVLAIVMLSIPLNFFFGLPFQELSLKVAMFCLFLQSRSVVAVLPLVQLIDHHRNPGV